MKIFFWRGSQIVQAGCDCCEFGPNSGGRNNCDKKPGHKADNLGGLSAGYKRPASHLRKGYRKRIVFYLTPKKGIFPETQPVST